MAPDELIDDFLARYRKEYDFYDLAARLAAQFLEGRLVAAGVRSIVTSRAKAVGRLEEKVRSRAKDPKTNYACVDDIFKDIVDLAGVRVALYFPGKHAQVESIIRELFDVLQEKEFPRDSAPPEDPPPQYRKRFSGYWARHYRARLKGPLLGEAQKRYAEANIEVQVASVLMHSWAEVEHDLIYKPQQGPLSYEEHSILDKLNGMVLAGEIALEQLQRAEEARVAAVGREFSNHYDLASHLHGLATRLLGLFDQDASAPVVENALGRIDLLFEFLKELNLATPDRIQPLLHSLSPDLEKEPLAKQIIDQLLSEGEDSDKRHRIYRRLRQSRPAPGYYAGHARGHAASVDDEGGDRFLERWAALERKLKERAKERGAQGIYASGKLLSRLGIADEALLKDFERIRRTRSEVLHGMSLPPPDELRDAGRRMEEIAERLDRL